MIKEFLDTDTVMSVPAKFVSKLPVTAMHLTVASIFPAVAGLFLVMNENIIAGMLCFILSGVLDCLDGAVARFTNTASHLGAFVDGSVDRLVDFLIIFSFLFIDFPEFLFPAEWWVAITAYWTLVPTIIVAYANHRQAVNDPHEKVVWRILNRPEMFVLWMLSLFVSTYSVRWGLYIFVFTTIMSIITSVQCFWLAVMKAD